MAWEAFSRSYYVLSNIHEKVLGVSDKPCLNYALRPKDLSHEVLEHRRICLR